jgi:hypothetical protein
MKLTLTPNTLFDLRPMPELKKRTFSIPRHYKWGLGILLLLFVAIAAYRLGKRHQKALAEAAKVVEHKATSVIQQKAIVIVEEEKSDKSGKD